MAMRRWQGMGCSELLFFFFQAEDGIRGLTVTGVQTCALPILVCMAAMLGVVTLGALQGIALSIAIAMLFLLYRSSRSEERRVGKECRARWSPHHLKKHSDMHNDSAEGKHVQLAIAGPSNALHR